jgi:hypothetical protein
MLTIANNGNSTLNVNNISYPSGFSGNWASGSIAPGSSQTVTVILTPSAATNYSGNLVVNSDATGGVNSIPVSGNGTVLTSITALTGNLAFGNVSVGSTATAPLVIANNGNSTLNVSAINYPEGFSGSWAGGAVGAGASQTVTVTFRPSAAISYGGNVSVRSDATSGINSIAISGAGIKATATVALGNLLQTYDGGGKSATTTTTPASLIVTLTYNGSTTLPSAAGIYQVIGTITNPNYSGSATNTLIIAKATATVTLENLAQTYDGTARPASTITTPPGLGVVFTYNGSPNAPVNPGSYAVVGTINDPNYTGSAEGILVIGTSFKITGAALKGNVFSVLIATVQGSTYILQSTRSIANANWTQVQEIVGDGTEHVLQDTQATSRTRFYRVAIEPQ